MSDKEIIAAINRLHDAATKAISETIIKKEKQGAAVVKDILIFK